MIMKALVTGFDPFGGEAINPSWEAVKAMVQAIRNAFHGNCRYHDRSRSSNPGGRHISSRSQNDDWRNSLILLLIIFCPSSKKEDLHKRPFCLIHLKSHDGHLHKVLSGRS